MATLGPTSLKRRRGAVKGCTTKIATNVIELELDSSNPVVVARAKQLSKCLETLDDDYKTKH